MKIRKQDRESPALGCGCLVRRARRPKHKMARFPGGWNYRGYCVYRKCNGHAGCLWKMADENNEWAWFFRTLAEFRQTCDRWERERAKEDRQANSSPNNRNQPTP